MLKIDGITEFTGQWAILPARVRYDKRLPANAKLIYAEIAAKINEEGFCFCHNAYFSERLGIKRDTVSTLIKRLEDAEYIRIDVDVSRVNSDRRRIYLTSKPYEWGVSDLNRVPPIKGSTPEKSGTGFKSEGVPQKNPIPIENNNLKYNTPYNPPEAPPAPAEEHGPKWKPERFEKFWAYYPCHKSKKAAVKAWDKLKPSDELLAIIARALTRQMATEEWQRGIGIPYASTYLNNERWMDEIGPLDPMPENLPAGGDVPTWT